VIVIFTVGWAMALLWALSATPALAQSAVIHVTPDGDPTAVGADWGTATTLTRALSLAAAGDELWVATGVYTPGTAESDSFVIPSGVTVYGGFAATETLRSERDWAANPTVLSGDIGGDDTTDARDVVTTTAHISGSNADHVVWMDGTSTPITGSTRLDGVIITAGQASGSGAHDDGGGLYCNGSGGACSPTLANVTFSANRSDWWGGAMFNYGYNGESSPTLTNVRFINNAVGRWGGAMYNYGNLGGVSNPTLTGVVFRGNTAVYDGGALFNGGVGGTSNPTLIDVLFQENVSQRDGGAITNDGSDGGESSPTLRRVHFIDNWADRDGGAILNYAGNGGESSPTLLNVRFAGNGAAENGGAIYNGGWSGGVSNPTLVNVSFRDNAAPKRGGAVINDGNSGESSPALINVTFFGNQAGWGGALYNYGRGTGGVSQPSITNAILWGNTVITDGAQIYNENADTVVDYSLVQGGESGIADADAAPFTAGSGNLSADPLFVDASNGDLRLDAGSPAIDAGDNGALAVTTDLAGAPRFYDDPVVVDRGNGGPPLVDLGAYERQSASCAIFTGVIYVDQGAAGANAGTDWADAYVRLQDGLSAAGACAPAELWVATGVYTPGLSRSDSFVVPPDVALYGGFVATETVRTERDWAANPTVLSGDLGGDDTTDARGVVTDTTNIVGSNTYHVVTLDGTATPITGSTRLDGVTITGGRADGGGFPDYYGGGLYCNGRGSGAECSPTLGNVRFWGNAATYGGALFNDGAFGGRSAPRLVNGIFAGNAAAGSGGALFNYGAFGGESSPALTNVTLTGNAADYGGAMVNEGSYGASRPTLTNVILWGNAAAAAGAQLYNSDADVALAHSLVQGGCPSGASCDANLIDAAPLFVDATGGDYRLLPGSPAIDAGDNSAITATTDLAGNARIQGGAVDMGAYESQGFSLTVSGGDDQQVNPGQSFPQPLSVTVSSLLTEPVGPGGVVSFTAPTTGASLTTPTFTATTDGGGVATATVAANGIGGRYAVTATARGATAPVVFTLSTNHRPQAMDDTALVLRDNDSGELTVLATQPVTLTVLANDSDVDGDSLSLTAVGTPSQGGTATVDGDHIAYTPADAFTGAETFTYTVQDTLGLTDTATVTVTVIEGDDGGSTEPGGPGETLVITGTGTSEAITVTVDIPTQSPTDTLSLVYTGLATATTPANTPPEGFVFAGLHFTLDAYLNQQPQPNYTPTTPITLTLDYSQAEDEAAPQGEDSFELRRWDGSAWTTDGLRVVGRDPANDRLVVEIRHLSEFVLLGGDYLRTYLPLIVR
jgi:hypothetical protein